MSVEMCIRDRENTTSEDTNSTEEKENNTEETNTTSENSTSTEKKITMKIDDDEIMSTSFDETITTGKIQLSVGQASTDSSTVQGYVKQAQNVATVLAVSYTHLKVTAIYYYECYRWSG